ncbi:MAG: carboxypeptidase regulatory-like domain-containing protein [Bacteroidales bacterium]|nr:carboxypeptidase regulatory-like domain-containing protein [Bacteroidales bacterium]
MKKKNLLFSVALFFSILPMALFTSCDKDTNCYLDVKVVDEGIINPISGELTTGAPIGGAVVEIYQDGGTVYAKGVTGRDGVFSTYFNAPAIVKIKATLQLFNEAGAAAGERRGETSVRLQEGETTDATITLSSQVYY